MQEDRASFTAAWVAFARALATLDSELSRVCNDPIAIDLLPRSLARLLRRGDGQFRSSLELKALRLSTLGLTCHIALRTAVIDEAVRMAAKDGIDQIVLLGAGFDARAYRMPELATCTVFEVDHPATQRAKRRRITAHAPLAKEVRHAPCDFMRVSLDQALDDADFDGTRPSCWIWEGVTMYLPNTAVDDTLGTIASHSSERSTLVTSYLTDDVAYHGKAVAMLGQALLKALSEPITSTFPPAEIEARMRTHGFDVLFNAHPFEQAVRFGIAKPIAGVVPDERLVVGRKTYPSTPRYRA
jgi:methyltransferase (TIGR00027 family)